MKWHQKEGRNLLGLLLFMLVSSHTCNLTGVNGAPDNMTHHQEKWFQKEGLPQKAMDSALESKSIPTQTYNTRVKF